LLAAVGARTVAWQLVGPASGATPSIASASRPAAADVEPWTFAELPSFVYELLDAHDDTARIAREQDAEMSWEAHLDYLRALQRKGRELLAALDGPTTRPGL
jgi:hypothetical protein